MGKSNLFSSDLELYRQEIEAGTLRGESEAP